MTTFTTIAYPPPSEWKYLQDITHIYAWLKATSKLLQKGIGLNYQPMEASLAAANIDRVRSRAVVRKARKQSRQQ